MAGDPRRQRRMAAAPDMLRTRIGKAEFVAAINVFRR
jgi:hypothetical protein